MKLTFEVNGREMTFLEEELVAILEKNFDNPKIDWKSYEVNPMAINQELFNEKRIDPKQECTRQIILDALEELRKNPKKYARFKLMIPEKSWSVKTLKELKEIDSEKHLTDWVELALGWAQRITNGETWESICNEPDTSKWYRLILWKNSCVRLLGGSSEVGYNISESTIHNYDYEDEDILYYSVPIVTSCNC